MVLSLLSVVLASVFLAYLNKIDDNFRIKTQALSYGSRPGGAQVWPVEAEQQGAQVWQAQEQGSC